MKAWTDYQFQWLENKAGEISTVREIEVISYEGEEYCKIKVGGKFDTIRCNFIYQKPGRFGEVPQITRRQLMMLKKKRNRKW